MYKRTFLLFMGIAMLLFLVAVTYGCAPTASSQKPAENYQGPIAEGPNHQTGDYWIYERPDGVTHRYGSGKFANIMEFPLWVGRIWKYRTGALPTGQPQTSKAHRISVEVTCEATAFKPITVEAGSFEAFECHCECRLVAAYNYERYCGEWTVWYAPQVKNIVKKKTQSTAGILELTDYNIPGRVAQPVTYHDFYNRALSFRQKGDFDRAIQDYDQALSLNPNHADSFMSRGIAFAGRKDYDRAIQDYDQAIRLNPEHARAFFNRGLAYHNKHEIDRALQDYDRAVLLDSKYAAAFNNRGNVHRDKSDYDRAVRDYDEAIRVNPNYALAFRNRGRARFYQGQFGSAAQDLAKAFELQSSNLHISLWLYLSETRAGQNGRPGLEARSQKHDLSHWPGPVIEFYLSKIDEKALYAAAENSDPKKRSEQICEANFYAAEAKLLKGAIPEAIPLLRAAEKDCPPNFIERRGASAELKRLGQ